MIWKRRDELPNIWLFWAVLDVLFLMNRVTGRLMNLPQKMGSQGELSVDANRKSVVSDVSLSLPISLKPVKCFFFTTSLKHFLQLLVITSPPLSFLRNFSSVSILS